MLSIILSVVMGFSAGVLFCELTRAPEPTPYKPKQVRRRLQTNLVARTDGRVFAVRCRPRAWRRLCNRMEDRQCNGR